MSDARKAPLFAFEPENTLANYTSQPPSFSLPLSSYLYPSLPSSSLSLSLYPSIPLILSPYPSLSIPLPLFLVPSPFLVPSVKPSISLFLVLSPSLC